MDPVRHMSCRNFPKITQMVSFLCPISRPGGQKNPRNRVVVFVRPLRVSRVGFRNFPQVRWSFTPAASPFFRLLGLEGAFFVNFFPDKTTPPKKKIKNNIYIYTWNPNDPCFDWTRPSFGGFNPQNKGQTGSRYIYKYNIYIYIIIYTLGLYGHQ